MRVKPLWLREKLFWRWYAHCEAAHHVELFEHARLELAPDVILKLLPSDIAHRHIAYLGFYELEVSRRIARLAKQGGLLVDVGANYGYYCCLWCALNPDNRVIAFEASPNNVTPLKENIRANGLAHRIEVRTVAIGKRPGTLPFTRGSPGQTGWGGLLLEKQSDAIDVAVDTLDNLFPEGNIQVLKVDTEGADTWVLQGAEQLLTQKRIQHIFFEQNTPRMSALGIQEGEAQNMLAKRGYQVRHLGGIEYYARRPIVRHGR